MSLPGSGPEPPERIDSAQRGRDHVALVLALGTVLALILFVFAMVWDALRSPSPGLSENATQVLAGAFGAIIGALAGYMGGRPRQPRE